MRYEGFYFYRNDRLLQAGGWNRTHPSRSECQLARVSIEVDSLGGPAKDEPRKVRCPLRQAPSSLMQSNVPGARTNNFQRFPHGCTGDIQEIQATNLGETKSGPSWKGIDPDLRGCLDDESSSISRASNRSTSAGRDSKGTISSRSTGSAGRYG